MELLYLLLNICTVLINLFFMFKHVFVYKYSKFNVTPSCDKWSTIRVDSTCQENIKLIIFTLFVILIWLLSLPGEIFTDIC